MTSSDKLGMIVAVSVVAIFVGIGVGMSNVSPEPVQTISDRPAIQQQGAFSLDSKVIDNVMTPTKTIENRENKKTNEHILKEINALKNSNKELRQEIQSLENRLEGIHIETKRLSSAALVDSDGEEHPVNLNCVDRDYAITGVEFQNKDNIFFAFTPSNASLEHSLTVDLTNNNFVHNSIVGYYWICSKIVIPQE